MTEPWLGDACSLGEAFRRRELSPVEAVQAVVDAAAASPLNAVCHVDAEGALARAADADTSLPLGGVPFGVKELEPVQGWPFAYGTALLAGVIGPHTCAHVERVRDLGGAVPTLQTTSSEVGLVAYTSTKVHGTTGNPWDPARTPGGSSGGSAAAVAAGVVPIATGTDGGGSIRIPAGYCGLVGLKTSFRRIPFAPDAPIEPLTQTAGCLSRSVRDTARWLDVASGPHPHDPFALPERTGWEAALGTLDLSGLRVAVLPTFGGAVVAPHVVELVEEVAAHLVRLAGLRRVDAVLDLPDMGPAWLAPALPVLWAGIGPFWPDVRDLVTDEVAFALDLAAGYDIATAAGIDPVRRAVTAALADLFDQVDLVISATNPDDPHPAEGPSPTAVAGVPVESWNVGRLTMPMNLSGLPAISVPAGLSPAGMPVGLQVVAPRFREELLLDVALLLERERPWPLVRPTQISSV